MAILSDNMRFLRARLELSQQKVADHLKITRGRYAKYEDGHSEPPIQILIRISRFFNTSIDVLVAVDVRKYRPEELLKLPDNRVVLPIMVDSAGENKIEIIPQKAKMGYLAGYTDPGYIESLQHIALPFLGNGKYRAFPADGDSMPPFKDGTFIVGKYLEGTADLRVHKTYIFITRSEGIVYKRLRSVTEEQITVSSDNNFYPPYDIHLLDILEIWEYACSISLQEFEPETSTNQTVKDMFLEIRKDIRTLNEKIPQ